MTFEQLNLIEPILRALKEEGYTSPTPIQEQTIPFLLEKKDVLGCAQTGTGKTAAFSIPILHILYNEKANYAGKRKIKALVVTPTRELAIQIGESFSAYGKYTGIKNTVIFGGVNQNPQTNSLSNGIDVLIATPGRLLDLIAQGHISLANLEFFVLDEADRMLDMGFIHDVKKIITVIPKKRQSLFFSATMPPTILTLAGTILNDPEKVEVAPVSSTADTIQQKIFFVAKGDKPKLLIHLLETENIETVLVFTKTKHGADKVCKTLVKQGIKAEAIHGNKAQNARQRALTNFKNKDIRVLVATDIAARGIDVDELQHVINFDIPNISETYVHRIGRTGRAGNSGTSFSFCGLEEKPYLKDIQKLINKSIPVEENHPFAIDSSMPVQKPNTPKKAPIHKAKIAQKTSSSSSTQEQKKPKQKRWYKS
jgi:ATP-dependent RNA helicase RhlE